MCMLMMTHTCNQDTIRQSSIRTVRGGDQCHGGGGDAIERWCTALEGWCLLDVVPCRGDALLCSDVRSSIYHLKILLGKKSCSCDPTQTFMSWSKKQTYYSSKILW